MTKVFLENLTLTWHMEGKEGRGRQRATYLTSLGGWTAVAEADFGKGTHVA